MNQAFRTAAHEPSTGQPMAPAAAAARARPMAFATTPRGRVAGIATHAPPAHA